MFSNIFKSLLSSAKASANSFTEFSCGGFLLLLQFPFLLPLFPIPVPTPALTTPH